MPKRPTPETGVAAVAFDIDGVFKYGREWSPDGLAALAKMEANKLPYVFVTNGGGGLTESAYAKGFAAKVLSGAQPPPPAADTTPPRVNRSNMILSYTPWDELLAPKLVDKRVLIVGDPRERVLEVAASYGLKRAVHYQDYARKHSTLNPFRQAKEDGTSHTAVAVKSHDDEPDEIDEDEEAIPFAAILVMCDPYEWFEAIQCAVDIMCSPRPYKLEYDPSETPVPVHFSNPDILWKAQHPFPRFGQGAFKIALRELYRTRLHSLRVPDETHDELVAGSFTQWGKPTAQTFRFLEERLRTLAASGAAPLNAGTAQRFYMVGDNPASDMEGVRRSNIFHRGGSINWQGVLVKTGVYKEGDETNGATKVAAGVMEAVDWILAQEGLA